MKKIYLLQRDVDVDQSVNLSGYLDELSSLVDGVPEKYRDSIVIAFERDSGFYDEPDDFSMEVFYERPETKAERKERLEEESGVKAKRRSQMEAQYRQLGRRLGYE